MDRVHACLDGKNLLEKVCLCFCLSLSFGKCICVNTYILSNCECPQCAFVSCVLFLCIAPKVDEEVDEGVQTEMERTEKIQFLGKDEVEGENVESSLFEELTQEVKTVKTSGHCFGMKL